MEISVFKNWVANTVEAGRKQGLEDEDIGLVLLEMAFSVLLWAEIKRKEQCQK